MMVLRDYGTMRLRDVLEPAIGYAENGHPLVERACATIATVERALSRALADLGGCLSARTARCRRPGTLFTNKRHAETYKRILKEAEAGGGGREAEIERARRAWSQGFVAEAIDALLPQQRGDGRQRPARTGACSPRRTWRPGCRRSKSPCISTTAAIACSSRTPGRRARCCCRCWRCSRASISTAWRRPTPSSSTSGSSAPSSPTPTARPSTAIPSSSTCRWRRCCRRPTTPSGASSSATQPRMEQRPGRIEGYGGRVIVKGARALGAGAGEPTFARINTGHGADERVDAAAARCAATRCTSTSSTRPATCSRPRRPAAGCSPRR